MLLTALVQQLRTQRSTAETLKAEHDQSLRAPELAKTLSSNPKLMTELAIELTKLA